MCPLHWVGSRALLSIKVRLFHCIPLSGWRLLISLHSVRLCVWVWTISFHKHNQRSRRCHRCLRCACAARNKFVSRRISYIFIPRWHVSTSSVTINLHRYETWATHCGRTQPFLSFNCSSRPTEPTAESADRVIEQHLRSVADSINFICTYLTIQSDDDGAELAFKQYRCIDCKSNDSIPTLLLCSSFSGRGISLARFDTPTHFTCCFFFVRKMDTHARSTRAAAAPEQAISRKLNRLIAGLALALQFN